jgi:D-sedoheptulose 7-phosphate isomerase
MLKVARTHGPAFRKAAAILVGALKAGRKVLFLGNGGSAADAQHLAGELVGRFMKERGPLPAVALNTDTSVLTAIANDYGYDRVFSRQVAALARPGDVVVALSTSGRSPSVLAAIRTARSCGALVIGLTGAKGRGMARLCDAAFVVPHRLSPVIQESHMAIGHALCGLVDDEF